MKGWWLSTLRRIFGLTCRQYLLYSPNFDMRKIVKLNFDFKHRDIVVLVLTVLGLGAADWFFTPPDSSSCNPASASASISASIKSGSNGSQDSELPENMLPTGKPANESADSFFVLPALKTDNNNGRLKTQNDTAGDGILLFHKAGTRCSVLTTFCLIDSGLGQQFTLVGARPSGTS